MGEPSEGDPRRALAGQETPGRGARTASDSNSESAGVPCSQEIFSSVCSRLRLPRNVLCFIVDLAYCICYTPHLRPSVYLSTKRPFALNWCRHRFYSG